MRGRLVEEGRTADVFRPPRHPYTAHLIASLPRIGDTAPKEGLDGRAAQPRRSAARLPLPSALSARHGHLPPRGAADDRGRARPSRRLLPRRPGGAAMSAAARGRPRRACLYASGGLLSRRASRAVDDVSLRLDAGKPEIFTIIGESGSGKTTLARMILNMVPPSAGTIRFRGTDLATIRGRARAAGLHAAGAADLPEPVRGLQSAEARRPLSVRHARGAWRASRRRPRSKPRPTRRCARSACRWPRCAAASRTSCRAASCSASRSRAR